jgi:transposase-like protein
MIFPITKLLGDQASEKWLLRHLHPNGLRCPACQAGLKQARKFRVARRTQLSDYRCRQCGTVYNLYTGTVFAHKQLRPQQVVMLLRGICKGEPSTTLAEENAMSWRTVHELRRVLQDNCYQMLPQTPLPERDTETDEMFQNAGEKRRKTR